MKCFFVCYTEEWPDLSLAFRKAGYPAPSQARSGINSGMIDKIVLYDRWQGQPISAFVVDERMAQDGVRALLEQRFPEVPVLTFSFNPSLVEAFEWGLYVEMVEQALEERHCPV